MKFKKDQNRRKYPRIEFSDTIVMNPMGACEVTEMSSGGFSFQCLFEHSLSDEWSVDILNNSGVYIQKFPVERVWQSVEGDTGSEDICGLAVGVRFKNLTSQQQRTLDQLIELNDVNQDRNSGLLGGVAENVHYSGFSLTPIR